jgi:RNA polymerase sigma-70 factor (ECF subfamily)
LYQLCGSSHLDDLVQDVFLRAWKGLPKFQRSAQFATWLYRITWNVAQDQRRSFAQMRQRLQALGRVTPLQQDAPSLMPLHYQEVLHKALQELSLDHRIVLVLHDLEEQPQKDIAQILQIPVGTVKSRLFHARVTLRQSLIKMGVNL